MTVNPAHQHDRRGAVSPAATPPQTFLPSHNPFTDLRAVDVSMRSVCLHLPRTTLQIGLSYTMVMENLCCMYIQQSAAANQSINHQSIIYLYQTRLLCSRHRPDFTRQTDRRQTKASLNASALTGLGIPILLRKVAMALCKGIYVKFGVFEGVWP